MDQLFASPSTNDLGPGIPSREITLPIPSSNAWYGAIRALLPPPDSDYPPPRGPFPNNPLCDFVHHHRRPERPRPPPRRMAHRLQLQPPQLHPVRCGNQVPPRENILRPDLPLPIQPPEHPPCHLAQVITPFESQQRSVLSHHFIVFYQSLDYILTIRGRHEIKKWSLIVRNFERGCVLSAVFFDEALLMRMSFIWYPMG